MPFTRPSDEDVDLFDTDAWCIDIDGEDCEPGTAQCPECGHMPTAGEDEHEWECGGTWFCAACELVLPVIPCQIETE